MVNQIDNKIELLPVDEGYKWGAINKGGIHYMLWLIGMKINEIIKYINNRM